MRLKSSVSEIEEALNGDLSEWHKLTILTNRKIKGTIDKEIDSLKHKLMEHIEKLDQDFFLRVQSLPGISEFQATQISKCVRIKLEQ